MCLSGTVHISCTNRLLRLSQGSGLYYCLLLKGYLEPKKIMAITFAWICMCIYIHLHICAPIYMQKGEIYDDIINMFFIYIIYDGVKGFALIQIKNLSILSRSTCSLTEAVADAYGRISNYTVILYCLPPSQFSGSSDLWLRDCLCWRWYLSV